MTSRLTVQWMDGMPPTSALRTVWMTHNANRQLFVATNDGNDIVIADIPNRRVTSSAMRAVESTDF